MLTLSARQEANLFAKIEVTGFCWNWISPLNVKGYGQFRVNNRMIRAHRVMWEWLVGPVPHGLVLDHLCENQACVNPDHLEPKTQKENVTRGFSLVGINSRKTHCHRGHILAGENLFFKTDRYGRKRICRTCKNDEQRTRRALNKQKEAA